MEPFFKGDFYFPYVSSQITFLFSGNLQDPIFLCKLRMYQYPFWVRIQFKKYEFKISNLVVLTVKAYIINMFNDKS